MPEQIKIGIVVPSYNQGKYIEQTLKSIIENRKNIDIKLIVIDGGSVDETVGILKKYEEHIDFWKSEKDNGQAAAINEGMKYTKNCKYVMWLNSDDVYESNHAVSDIAGFAEQANADVCYGKSYLINAEGAYLETYRTRKFSKRRLQFDCYISQPSVLVKRKAWEDVGGVNEGLQMCMDYELWIRLSLRYSIYYFKEYVGNTRIYKGTKTSTAQLRHVNETICILKKYYGWVPGRWILEKICLETGKKYNNRIVKMILRIGVMFFAKQYIEDAKDVCNIEI